VRRLWLTQAASRRHWRCDTVRTFVTIDKRYRTFQSVNLPFD
jgi:hypothetical protein